MSTLYFLRRIKITQRLWLILLVSVISLATITLSALDHLKKEVYAAEVTKATHLVESAHSLLAAYHQKELSGELTPEEARKNALEMLRQLRYSGNEYFWVNDMNYVMIMHPLAPQTEGMDLSKVVKEGTVNVIKEMVDMAKHQPAGHIQYDWVAPGGEVGVDEAVQRLAAFTHFKPWDYMIGTGVYLTDVEARLHAQMINAFKIGSAILLFMIFSIYIIGRSISRPLNLIVRAMADIAGGEADLTRKLDSRAKDEVSLFAKHFNTFTETLRELVEQIDTGASEMIVASQKLDKISNSSLEDMNRQSRGMEQVAASINQITSGVHEVANSANAASSEVESASHGADVGRVQIEKTIEQIKQLSTSIEVAVDHMETLSEDANEIASVLLGIRSIAEQTNLLALNASIEAARAGEFGLGFAVVAEEVRNLARRTQKSTGEIQEVIRRLQSNTEITVNVIRESSLHSEKSVEQVNAAGTGLVKISESMRQLVALNASIASSTTEQSTAVENVNRNVAEAVELAQRTAVDAEHTAQASKHLATIGDKISTLLSRFKT